MKKLIFIILLLCVLPKFALSAPTISDVSDEGDTWTITSGDSDFGSGSAPKIWSNFESGTLNAVLKSTPDVGTWRPFGTRTVYANTKSNSGTQSAYSLGESGVSRLLNVQTSLATEVIIQTSDRIYLSMMYNIERHGNTGQDKVIQLQGNGVPSGYDFGPGIFPGCSSGSCLTYSVPSSLNNDGYVGHGEWPAQYETEDEWHRIEMVLERSTDGVSDGTIIIILDQAYLSSNYDGTIETRDDNQDWEKFQFLRSGSNATADFEYWVDDIYLHNSWARVEVGNNSVYGDCTWREPQIQITWGPGGITATKNRGQFELGVTYYLFVKDEDNIPSAGYPITYAASTAPVVTCQSNDTTTETSYAITATYTLEGARTVSTCTWSNSLGGSGSLTATGGNISGTITGLSVGDNVITITLTDSSAESGNCNTTITRTAATSYTAKAKKATLKKATLK